MSDEGGREPARGSDPLASSGLRTGRGADARADARADVAVRGPWAILGWIERITGHEVSRQFVTFALVGIAATGVFVVTYNLARLGTSPFVANAVAIIVSALANYALNRRITFGIRSRSRWARQLAEFSIVGAVTMAASTAALALLFQLYPDASQLAENIAVLGATGALFIVRFWAMRNWVFDPAR